MNRTAITHLSLSNFRSHRRTRVTPDAGLVAFHGPNGAGKTNILEAVSLLSPGRGLRRAGADALARLPDAPGWRVQADIDTSAGARRLQTGAEGGKPRQVRIDDKPAPQVALGRVLAVLWLTPAMDRLWLEGSEGRRRFLDRMALSLFPGHGDAALAYEKAMRQRNRLLRDGIRDPGWYDALEAQMAISGATLARQRRATLASLAAAGAGAATAFPVADLALTGPDARPQPETAETIRAALADSRARDMAAGRSTTGPHRIDLTATFPGKGIAAAQCSTGEQKALLISLVLANARALAAAGGAAPILLLDEVAAHLDAGRRAALYAELSALSLQVWLTGTGPELFAVAGITIQLYEVTQIDGLSVVTERTPK